ncbi:Beta-galactosidase BoGH2A [Diplonema papillatum]|nr:Beta-galactosidase BoGH2A [Diplonema papillatum]
MRTAVLLAVSCLLLERVSGKVVVPFGNGWRFHFGDDPEGPGGGPNECAFKDVTNQTCTNMDKNTYRWTEYDCMMSCCYENDCRAWQYTTMACFHGTTPDTTCSGNGTYTGGLRKDSPPFKRDYSLKDPGYNDSAWPLVSLPHDYSINQTFADDPDDAWHGYLPRNTSWYRKNFTLPAEWKGRAVYLVFEGAHQFKQVYINGEWVLDHPADYTEFTVRLDNISSVAYGGDAQSSTGGNVIAIRTDGTYGSGHWYEGGGIYRDVRIVAANETAHFVHHGVFVDPETDGSALRISAEIESFSAAAAGRAVPVEFSLSTADGVVLSTTRGPDYIVATAGSTYLNHTWDTSALRLRLWSPQAPTTYVFKAQLGGSGGAPGLWSDVVTFTTAFRTTHWGPKFALNGVTMQLNGFSHHTSFAGTGAVSGERLNLFRVQTSKAMGANFWRCSVNPYEQHLYEMLARVGLLAWDENRDFGFEYRQEMHDLVKMHRNHAPVLMWSFCNEADCDRDTQNTSATLKAIAEGLDPSRPTTANMHPSGGVATEYLDVVGYSHGLNESFIKEHGVDPAEPLLLGECCSCPVDRMAARNFTDCMREQNSPGDLPYVAGSTGVWSLMDYFGESIAWPAVTSAYGNLDISGFPKPHAYWYRLNWLVKQPAASVSRPLVNAPAALARITDVWIPGGWAMVHCAVSTAWAEVLVDGVLKGYQVADENGMTEWGGIIGDNTTNVTCNALPSITSAPVATHTLVRPGDGVQLQLLIDVPSPITGTGKKLYLDGKDMALLRAQVVDSFGVVNSSVVGNVTFAVTSGPGRLIGLGGAPDSHVPVQGDSQAFYGGLIRAVVGVTLDCTTPSRNVTYQIDRESGPLRYSPTCPAPLPPIVVTATSESFGTATATILTSSDPSDPTRSKSLAPPRT